MEFEHVTRKTRRKSKANRRRRGLGGCMKAVFRSILIHSGCLSPNDHDDILIAGHRHHTSADGCDDGINNSPNLNYSNRNAYRNNETDAKADSGRHRHGPKDRSHIFTDGIEEKQGHLGLNNKYSGAMFSLQNCTLHCEVCRNGETYWASFTERSFYRGHRFKLYRGVINGQGPQSGEKCVVKVFLQRPGTEDLCRAEVCKSEKLRQLARGFSQRTKRFQDRIRCPPTYWAQVDEVSKLKQLFFTGERKLRIGESVLFEPDIRIADDKPGKLRKVSCFLDTRGKHVGRHIYPVLDAFVHYTYHSSKGELVACGFEGVVDDEGFSLVTPIIHSKSKIYGDGDQGEAGIVNVFRNHVCNSLCRDLTSPSIAAKPPRESGPVMATAEAKEGEEEEEEEVDLGESSSMCHFPQDSTDERNARSDLCMGTSVVSNSKASECTESMGAYLEPSAPDISECLRDELLTPPPAYTRQRAEQVSHWLIQEEAGNSLLQMYTHGHGPAFQILPRPTRRSVSVISQTAMITPGGDNGIRRSSDINANFPPNPALLPRMHVSAADRRRLQHAVSASETTRSEETMETRSTNSAGSGSYPSSSQWTSEATSARSDVAMETGSSSCSSPCLSTRHRQEGSTCSSRGVDNAIYQNRQVLFYQPSDVNRNTTTTTSFFDERPPSYEESEATRHFHQGNVAPGSIINSCDSGLDGNFQGRVWTNDTSTTPLINALPGGQNSEANISA